jgi:hypothetical protein
MEDLVSLLIQDWMCRPAHGQGSERAPESLDSLPSRLVERGVGFPAFADAFACEVANLYVSSQISFDEGDNAIGWLHHFSLRAPNGDLLDGFAWQVYTAFDAGEYHPTANAADDLPNTYTLPRLRQLLATTAA